MNLSIHFTLEELTDSQTAARAGIDNTPGPEVIKALRRTATGLEMVRTLLQSPVLISSGFRCEELERLICDAAYRAWCGRRSLPVNDASWTQYFESKSHPSGEAADFTSPSFGAPESVMAAIFASPIPYDQLILEFGRWVHISFGSRNRRQALVIDAKGTRNYPS